MSPDEVEMFSVNCTSAQVDRIPGAEHSLKMQEQPNLVLQPVKDFLTHA